MSYHFLRGLGAEGCPPCTFLFSGDCIPCPEGSDFPECDGCVDGVQQEDDVQPAPAPAPQQSGFTDSFWGMVSLGVATTLTVTIATAWLSRKMKV